MSAEVNYLQIIQPQDAVSQLIFVYVFNWLYMCNLTTAAKFE